MTEKKKSLYERQVIAMERQAEALERLANLFDICVIKDYWEKKPQKGTIRIKDD